VNSDYVTRPLGHSRTRATSRARRVPAPPRRQAVARRASRSRTCASISASST